MLFAVSVYANTCTYDGVQVSLEQEWIGSSSGPSWPSASFTANTCNKTIRVQIKLTDNNGKEISRQWVSVNFDANGYGTAQIKYVPKGGCNISLIQMPGQCY